MMGEYVDWSGKYVLIAEDEYSNFELLSYMLRPTKIRIKQVTDGYGAIEEALNVERPDLILMDIKMPDLNGFEATKRIKEVCPDLPIIAQTAFAIAGDRELALSMGCDEYVSKPIKKLVLFEIMKRYLG
ncbi:MAG: response regulator [Bacteroidales bacterium]|nr:response regulator [Bacteroidales bacterium]